MTGKKVTEKITEQVADDIVKIYELIKKLYWKQLSVANKRIDQLHILLEKRTLIY